MVDMTRDRPLEDYYAIQHELEAYGHGLADKPQILVLNKLDAVAPETVETLAAQFPTAAIAISAATRQGLDVLLNAVWQQLEGIHEQPLAF
jgi:GTP-binding protein